jgi:hypothetical protein
MKTTLIVRRLGLDGNPLRRRTDKIAARLAALLLAVFLIGAPCLSAAAVGWAGHHGAAELRATRSWHQVSAVLLRGASAPTVANGVLGYYQVLAGGPHRMGVHGPAGSRSAPTWPLAARSGCGWTRRARRPVFR